MFLQLTFVLKYMYLQKVDFITAEVLSLLEEKHLAGLLVELP